MRPEVEVRRSARRTRTVSAYRKDGKVIVMIPARFTRAEEAEWIDTMLGKLERTGLRGRRTDEQLMKRAKELSKDYLHGKAVPTSERWVKNANSRWGSCTTGQKTIRHRVWLESMLVRVVANDMVLEFGLQLEPVQDGHI